VFSGIGVTEVLFVLGIVVLFFGSKRIPEIAKGLGSGIRNFKGSLKKGVEDDSQDRQG